MPARPIPAPCSTQSQVEAQIAEERKAALFVGQRPNLPLNSQLMLTHALNASAMQPDAPPASARDIVLDDAGHLLHRERDDQGEDAPPERQLAPTTEEKLVTVRRNENFEQVLRANGAGPNEGRSIVSALLRAPARRAGPRGQPPEAAVRQSGDGKRPTQLLG